MASAVIPGGEGSLAPQAFRRGEHMGRVFFSLAWQVTRVSSYARRPFPSKEIRRTSERDDPGPPVCHKNKRRMGV
jgi:hypothetical protein